jgi:hypothetical protein
MSDHGVMTTPIFDELRDETGIDLADERPWTSGNASDDATREADVSADAVENVRAAG